ncbi:MAG: imidazoleglycerol-phosphate dehydratase HisB [Candidatus Omnitrophica bacterium]|nr:imidazoleglycerol-phosphate dehydratase HisB [Candidatus Omnitrophota bacterium]
MKKRKGSRNRKTQETNIRVKFTLDGTGKSNIDTGVPFLNHMLTLFARHGLFDLDLKARGDLGVDAHHTVEDCGILLGQALFKAVGDKKGIKRFGYAYAPMDEALARVRVVLDLSGRPGFFFSTNKRDSSCTTTDKNARLIKHFLKSFSDEAKLTLHVDIIKEGGDIHHAMEAVFKAMGLALDQATTIDKRAKDIPSTKGTL